MYKYSDPEHTKVTNTSENIYDIHPGSFLWEDYLQWVAEGGVTEAFDTRSDLEKLQDAISEKIQEITAYGDNKDLQPFEYPSESGVFYKVTDAVLNTIQYCNLLGTADSDPLPMNGGKWDNYNGTVSTSMTLGDLKNLYKAGYEVPAYNYGVLKSHIFAVMQLTTVEAVESYDFTENWI
jgi:hypothetical protein